MKLLAMLLAVTFSLTACDDPSYYFPANDKLAADISSQYLNELVGLGFRELNITCHPTELSPNRIIHVSYDFDNYPERELDVPVDTCELGSEAKISMPRGIGHPKIEAVTRLPFTIETIKPYIDAMLADRMHNHL
jgi:predicted small lipoprotein YifL